MKLPGFQDDPMLVAGASEVTSDLGDFFSMQRPEHAAVLDERARLARELHDGVLQSLTGARLQLEALSRLIDENPQAVRQRLHDIEEFIAEQQRELRLWIQKLHPTVRPAAPSNTDFAEALKMLCRQIEWQWALRVELIVSDSKKIPRTLADHVYRLVQEALSNVARHAHAQVGYVDLEILEDRVFLVVADDGNGFAFHGRYDLDTLTAKQLGPASLKERVASLRGELVLTSALSGSRLEISLPLDQAPVQGPHPMAAA